MAAWIKLHREFFSSPTIRCLQSNDARAVALAILVNANWKSGTTVCRKCATVITVERGDCWMTQRDLAAFAQVGRQVVKTTISRLVKTGFMTLEKCCQLNPRMRIVKYAQYQGNDDSLTTAQPLTNPDRRIKTIPKASTRSARQPQLDSSWLMADRWHKKLLSHMPGHAVGLVSDWGKSVERQKWAYVFDLMQRQDNRNGADIALAMKWVHDDSPDWSNGGSWRINCQAPAKFRKQFDVLLGQARAADGGRISGQAEVDELTRQARKGGNYGND